MSAVELESVDCVSSSTDMTVGSSRKLFWIFLSEESKSELSESEVFENDDILFLVSSLVEIFASWLNERAIDDLSQINDALDDDSGVESSSPNVKCTSGGVSFPVSLLDESGGKDDSFQPIFSKPPENKNLLTIIF